MFRLIALATAVILWRRSSRRRAQNLAMVPAAPQAIVPRGLFDGPRRLVEAVARRVREGEGGRGR